MEAPNKPGAPGAPPPKKPEDRYFPGDPIPVPEAIERDTDSAWAMWEDSVQPPSPDTNFADTDILGIEPESPREKT